MTQLTHVSADTPLDMFTEILERDAGLIVDNLIPEPLLTDIRSELSSILNGADTGQDDFSGFKTKRIGALIARTPSCRALAAHPLLLSLADRVLGPFCEGFQLHLTQAVSIGPGEGGQMLHRDRGLWGGHIPRRIETQLSTVWAITDFTEDNGATQVVPGSHLWDKNRQPEAHEIVSAEMSAGSVLIYTGTVLHGGGSNRTDGHRIGALLHYTLNWLRQQENQYL
ncbi:MAG: phytanoyl-CoA dioxygenase family protein, partial [Pirellulales bacterium]|nr:phytanoyl-CoA dioxygenase family protein [Pirellulales bacterium]